MALISSNTSVDMTGLDFSTTFASALAATTVTPSLTSLPPVTVSYGYLGLTASYSFPGVTIDSAYGVLDSTGSILESWMGTGITGGAVPTGGTVNTLAAYDAVAGTTLYYVTGLNLAMTDVYAMLTTPTTTDDMALMRAQLGGDDAFQLSGFADKARGFGGNDLFYMGAGNDRAWGGSGRDAIDGGDGNDRLFGQGGNDMLSGGMGNDLIDGGAGRDWVVFDNSADPAPQQVTVDLGITGPQFTGYGNDTLIDIENIAGGILDDILLGNGQDNRILGGDGNDRIAGRGGADTLRGGSGQDVLRGGGGADSLIGNAGADKLVGNGGQDLLDGGGGNDLMRGGGGADTFIFAAGSGTDTILDATVADTLALSSSLGIATVADALSAATTLGSDIVFGFGTDTLILQGAAGTLTATDLAGMIAII